MPRDEAITGDTPNEQTAVTAKPGEFEETLMILIEHHPKATAADLHEALESMQRPTSFSAIFATIDRLEKKAMVSTWVEVNPKTFRKQKYFTLTTDGRVSLLRAEQQRAFARSWSLAAKEGTT